MHTTRNEIPDFFDCVKKNLCFVNCDGGKCGAFFRREAETLLNSKGQVNLHMLGRHCEKGDFLAAKLNYLPGLETLEGLLGSDEVDLKVIFLRRDPRAMVRSWELDAKEEERMGRFKFAAKHFCARLHNDSLFMKVVRFFILVLLFKIVKHRINFNK